MSDCERLGDCDDARIDRLYDYLDGALSKDDLEEIKRHLDGCPECAKEHDLECVIRSVVKRSCEEHAPETLKSSILARISSIQLAEH